MTEKRQQYYLVDYTKLICALLVVMIHCLEIPTGHFFAELIVKCFSQQAVPYFFISSGFFFALKQNNGKSYDYAVNRIIYILKTYFLWVLIWSPMIIYRYMNIYSDSSFFYIILVIFRRIIFAGEGVYWYLLALAEALLLICLAQRTKKMKLLVCISFIMFLLGLYYDFGSNVPIITKFFSVIYFIFSWSNNVLMRGLPYTLVGYYIAQSIEKEKNNGKSLLGLYFVICIINVYIYLTGPNKIYIFFYPIQALLLFLISIKREFNNGNGLYAKECRKLSTVIYLVHTLFIYYVADILFTVYAPISLKAAIAIIGSILVYFLVEKCNSKMIKRTLMII